MHYEKLFEKGTIGRLELRNRVVMTAMGTMLGDWNGCSTPEQVRFYEERAKGGCGLIIPEFTSVDPDSGHCNRIQLGIWDERQIASFERICDAVHRHGAKIFVQLHHGGREAPPAINGGRQAMAPSVELNSVVGRATILPREMTIEDIDRLVGLFIQAALNAQAAGADGVEIHGAHGYLLQQFMSPYTNKRTDEYGGSMENRCRFIVRILKGIREVVEPGFVVGARINGNDFVEGGNDQDACVEIAKYLEPYVDYFNVSCGVYASAATMIEPCYSPEGWRSGFVKAIKSQVSVPVIAVNTVKHPQFAEQLLQEGVSDFVGMSRMHIADPYLVQKAMAGREDLIRKCLGCMNCNKSVVAGRTLHCALNPIAGHEVTFGDDKLVKNGNGRKVAIVGGGPSGLSAAYYLALMGHKVTVYEKRAKLGGMLRYGIPAYRLPREILDAEIASLLSVGIDAKVNVDIGDEITFDELRSRYDALYLALGAHTDKKTGIEGEDTEGVMSAVEMLREIGDDHMPDFRGKEIVVIGGGNVAMDVCRSAVRLGARKVSCVYRRRREDMTALPEEVEGAVAEGVELVTLQAPVRIETNGQGHAVALWTQPQIIGEMDDKGRPKPEKAKLFEKRIAADGIVVAIGQGVETHGFEQSKITIKRGAFVAEASGQIDNMDGVFAGGDCVTGPATVIRAIAAGKVAAANIDEQLGFHHEIRTDVEIPAPHLDVCPARGRVNTKEREAAQRKCDFEDIECGMTHEEACAESGRCLRCDHFGYGIFKGGRTERW